MDVGESKRTNQLMRLQSGSQKKIRGASFRTILGEIAVASIVSLIVWWIIKQREKRKAILLQSMVRYYTGESSNQNNATDNIPTRDIHVPFSAHDITDGNVPDEETGK